MGKLTLDGFRTFLAERFGSVFEAYSQWAGEEWTDIPSLLRTWNYRPLNDIPVSPEVRMECMVPVIVAYQGSLDWPEERQRRVFERLAILTVQEIVSDLPGLSANMRSACRAADTLASAHAAALTALTASQPSTAARYAASAAVNAAAAYVELDFHHDAACIARAACAHAFTATAAAYDQPAGLERIFRVACSIWLRAAEEG